MLWVSTFHLKLVVIFLILVTISEYSYSYWDQSWKYNKKIRIIEIDGIKRTMELVDLYIDSLDWKNKPYNNTIRILDSNEFEIASTIYNITQINGRMSSFNVLFIVNISANTTNNFYLYFDDTKKEIENDYKSDLKFSLNNSFYEINNSFLEIKLNENEGSIVQLTYDEIDYEHSSTIDPYAQYGFNEGDNNGSGFVFWNLGGYANCSILENNTIFVRINCTEDNLNRIYTFYYGSPHFDIFHEDDKDSSRGELIGYIGQNIVNTRAYGTNPPTIQINEYTYDYKEVSEGWLAAWDDEKDAIWYILWDENITNKTRWSDDYYNWRIGKNETDYFIDSDFKIRTGFIEEESDDDSIQVSRVRDMYQSFMHPLVVFLEDHEENKFSFSTLINDNIFVSKGVDFSVTVNYNETFLNTLTENNFQFYLDDEPSPISIFRNENNGTYSFTTNFNTNELGKHNFSVEVNYEGQIEKEKIQVTLLTYPKNKPLIITNNDWKNYISSVTTNKPVLIYDSSRKQIDRFIEEYNPDQIFQLETNLTFSHENYFVDSREALIKLFFNQSDLIIPSNKEIALKSSFMNIPIFFDPADETLEYLNPDIIYNFTTLNQVDSLFREYNPTPDYFIVTNPGIEESKFSFSLAKNRKSFIIFSSGNSEQSNIKLTQELKKFKLPDSYYFDKNLYLTLIGVPYFSVADPVDNNKQLITDTPYCDINDDGYQDLSCGRLTGSPEILSYQIEYSKLYRLDKTALILASYNTPGKYWDVLTAGGTMPNVIGTEIELLTKEFDVKRLVERRSEFDELDQSVLEKLNNLAEKLELTESATYIYLFSSLLGDLNKVLLVAKLGDEALYSIYEFDWSSSWKSLINLKPEYPKHLPVFNKDNLKEEIKNNQAVLYFSKGNETHWFIPLNSTWYSTFYEEFDPSNLDSNTLFYYLKYSNSFGIKDKMLGLNALSIVSSTSDSYNIYSGQTAYHFFKNFDQPVGKAMTETRNRNYELSQTELNKNKIYEKEYYDEILIGDPSLSFDPNLELEQSMPVEIENGDCIITYSFQPDYDIISFNKSSFIVFNDADDYLIDNNKPIIPIYKKTFTLPTNSEILDFSIKLSNKSYENIELPVIYLDPEYFDNQTFAGEFPDKFYWNSEIRLLDNRTVFGTLFSPVIYYSSNAAKVFDKIDISFKYASPIEITRINATNVKTNNPEKIIIELFNSLTYGQDANLSLKIQTNTYENKIIKQLKLSPGRNMIEVDYTNTDHIGNYSVSAIITAGEIVAGPKYTYFEVFEESFLEKIWHPVSKIFKINFTGFFKQTKNFKEDYTIKKIGDKTILDYSSIDISIHIEQETNETMTLIKTSKGELKIGQNPGIISYHFSTPDGLLIMVKEKGRINQEIMGDEKQLKSILNEILKSYENKLKELDLIT